MNKVLTKLGLGVAAAATALTAAAPASAQYYRGWHGYHGYRHDGGDVAAGALLGGVIGLGLGAAIADSNRPRYYDRGYYYDAPRPVYREYSYPGYYYDAPRCWDQWRFDPYWGRNVPVRVCR